MPSTAAGGVVTYRVALDENLLPHLGDLRRFLQQSQQIQPTGEPPEFVASFANEHSLDPPVFGGYEFQDKADTPTLAGNSHTTMLRSPADVRPREGPEVFAPRT